MSTYSVSFPGIDRGGCRPCENGTYAVQAALECTPLHRPVLLFQFVWQLKVRSCMVCVILKSSSDTELMLIYRPVWLYCWCNGVSGGVNGGVNDVAVNAVGNGCLLLVAYFFKRSDQHRSGPEVISCSTQLSMKFKDAH